MFCRIEAKNQSAPVKVARLHNAAVALAMKQDSITDMEINLFWIV
jgi:hypothetical protein